MLLTCHAMCYWHVMQCVTDMSCNVLLTCNVMCYCHVMTSIDIYWHLSISIDIYRHLLTSIDIYWHLLTSIDIYWHNRTTHFYNLLPRLSIVRPIVCKSSWSSLVCLLLYLYLSMTALNCSSNWDFSSISSLVSVTCGMKEHVYRSSALPVNT